MFHRTITGTRRWPHQSLTGAAVWLFAALLLVVSGPATAQSGKTRPKAVVTAFYELAFTKGEVREAALKYISPTVYIQHNPRVADGRDAFVAALGEALKTSGMRAEIKRVIAEGDLVVVHARWAVPGQTKASAVIDIFRVKDGRIVEHWDVAQPVPEASANSNTMF